MPIPKYNDIVDLIKKGSTLEAQEKIMELRETTISLQEKVFKLKDKILKKDTKIKNLKEELKEKNKMSFDGKLWWKEGDKAPFCPICYESDKKLIHLKFNEYAPQRTSGMVSFSADKKHYRCRICDNKYY